MKDSIKREIAIKLDKVLKEKGSLPVKVKQVLSKNLKRATPDPKSKRAKQFYNHHKYHSGPHITGQGAEHATYDFDDDDYEVDGGIQRRIKKDKQKRGYEPVENITKEQLREIIREEIQKLNEKSFDNVAKGWVKYFLNRHGKDIFKKVIAGREKERGKYSIIDSDLWELFGYYQYKDKKFGEWMGSLPTIDYTLVSDMLGKEFSKKYPVEW